MTKISGTQTLERGLTLIDAIAEAPAGGIRISELARMAGLELPTAHRLAAALERHGLVDRVGDSKKLCLGPKFFRLACESAQTNDLAEIARPALLNIASRSGDCIFLMVRSGFDAVCLDRQDGGYTIRSLTGHVGGSTPLGLGTGSVTILAHLPQAERQEILAANRDRIEALRHASPLEEDMAAIRRQGYCYENSASIAGVVGAAVPIMTPKGRPIASLAIGATEPRLPQERLPELLEMMRAGARLIESGIAATRAALQT